MTESVPKEETHGEQITEPTADQAAQEEQETSVAAQAAESVKYLQGVKFFESYVNKAPDKEIEGHWNGTEDCTIYIPDAQSAMPYIIATLADDAPADTTLSVDWTQMFTGKAKSEKLTDRALLCSVLQKLLKNWDSKQPVSKGIKRLFWQDFQHLPLLM